MAETRSTWYTCVRALVRYTFFQATGGLKPQGLENVPKTGGIIVSTNHSSLLDPPAVACAINRQLCFMAKQELFKGLFGKLISSLGAFPVRRGDNDTDAIRTAIELLGQERAVIVFPEGTRNDGVTMLPINRGTAMLAKRTGAWVLPVGVTGTSIVWPRGQKKLKRHRITIRFGPAFKYEDIAPELSEKERREVFGQRLERDIISLCHMDGNMLKSASLAKTTTESASLEPKVE